MDLVYGGYERQIGVARPERLVVEARPRDRKETGLARERQGMRSVDHRLTLAPLMRPSAPDKKRSP